MTKGQRALFVRVGAIVVPLAGVLVLGGCTSASGPAMTVTLEASPSQSGSTTGPLDEKTVVGVTRIPTPDRQPAPLLAGPAIGPGQSDSLNVTDYTGSVVVINAWASWCPPCREEIPGIIVTAGMTRSLGVIVIGLNVSDDVAAASAFIDASGMNYPSIIDADGVLLTTIPGVPPQALPSTIIIDRTGRIAARIIGPVTGEDLERLVREVAQEPAN